MSSRDDALLLSGATGFVGMEVMARVLSDSDRDVIALVRAADDDAAADRLQGILRDLLPRGGRAARGRVTAVAADLERPGLGLNARRLDEIAGRTRDVIHCAASVSFALPLPESRAINLDGTARMLELAERAHARGGLRRFAYISTAYVAGRHRGVFTEADHDLGQEFRNAYEQSKFEAEALVRGAGDRLPVTILRPSIVVGDRRTGWTSAFNVLYWPLRAFSRGLYDVVPAIEDAPLDIVSVDYVANAIVSLCEMPGGFGETYHLTAGRNASTVGEVVDLACGYFRRPRPKLVAPGSPDMSPALAQAAEYLPYFHTEVRYDDRGARDRLQALGHVSVPLRDYFSRLLDFATQSRWGRRPISRAQALTAAALRTT
jgi:thioester reductase-like protein